MSTPTLSTQIWSSSARVRPVEEKKIRSPYGPCSITGIKFQSPGVIASETKQSRFTCSCVHGEIASLSLAMTRSLLRQFALVVLVVELRIHPVLRAVAPERLGVFLGDEGVLHPVRDRRATLGEVHAGVVDVLLAQRTGFAPRIVRA